MTICKSSFAFLGCVALLAFSARTGLALEYQLSSPTVQPGERAVVEVRLPIPAEKRNDENAEAPQIQDDLLTQSKQLLILERDFRRNETEWVWHYEITAYQIGKVQIPPVEIKDGAQNYSTEAVTLEIATTRAEEDPALRDEYGALKHPIPWGRWFRLLLLAAILGAAVFFGRKYLMKYFKPKPRKPAPALVVPEPPKESDLDWLKRELARIRVQIEVPDPKGELVDDLTQVLREYFGRRTQRPVRAWTTREFHSQFSSDATAGKLVPLFDKCDHFKFAGIAADPKAIALGTLEESERVLLQCGT